MITMKKDELVSKAKRLGIFVGEKDSREVIAGKIADYYLKLDPTRLPQIPVMLGEDLRNLDEKDWARFQQMLEAQLIIAEPKIDGCRLRLHFTKDGIRCDTRHQSNDDLLYTERTGNLPQLNKKSVEKYLGTVIDCEVYFPGVLITEEASEELSATTALLTCGSEKAVGFQEKQGWLHFYAFDILFLKGKDIRGASLVERRRILENLFYEIKEDSHPVLEFLHILNQWNIPSREQLEKVFEKSIELGYEGLMLKFKSSCYRGKRSTEWLKLKTAVTYDGFITGFEPADPTKGFAGLVGAFKVSVFNEDDGTDWEIASVQPGTLKFRQEITNADGTLKKEFYGKCVEIIAQTWCQAAGNNLPRLRHARLFRFRPDKSQGDCKQSLSKIRSSNLKRYGSGKTGKHSVGIRVNAYSGRRDETLPPVLGSDEIPTATLVNLVVDEKTKVPNLFCGTCILRVDGNCGNKRRKHHYGKPISEDTPACGWTKQMPCYPLKPRI